MSEIPDLLMFWIVCEWESTTALGSHGGEIHTTEEAARDTAKGLSLVNPGDVYVVLKSELCCWSESQVKWGHPKIAPQHPEPCSNDIF